MIGADGIHSVVADAVRPEQYREKPKLLAGYYGYWSGLPMDGRFETYVRPERGCAVWPTSDGLTVVIVGWPYAEFARNRTDAERHYRATFDLVPELAERIARRPAREPGRRRRRAELLPQAVRPGLGAGRGRRLPQGLHHRPGHAGRVPRRRAVRDRLADALEGRRPFEDAMADYQAVRDAAVNGIYDLTCELATLEPPHPEMQQMLGSLVGDRAGMDLFARVCAGVSPPEEPLRARGGRALITS